MIIDNILISYLEDLSNLKLEDSEKDRLTEEMQKILKGMEMLNEVDTTGIPERSHPFDNVTSFREDVVVPSYPRELILQNAPVHNETAFVAPKTIE